MKFEEFTKHTLVKPTPEYWKTILPDGPEDVVIRVHNCVEQKPTIHGYTVILVAICQPQTGEEVSLMFLGFKDRAELENSFTFHAGPTRLDQIDLDLQMCESEMFDIHEKLSAMTDADPDAIKLTNRLQDLFHIQRELMDEMFKLKTGFTE